MDDLDHSVFMVQFDLILYGGRGLVVLFVDSMMRLLNLASCLVELQ